MRRALLALLVAGIANTACAARYQGTVTVEDEHTPAAEAPGGQPGERVSRSGTQPPVCSGDLPMPEYPVELLGPDAPLVRVRVDMLLNEEGFPEDVVAKFEQQPNADVAGATEEPRRTLFLEAAEDAVSQWRCSPAWRYPRPDEPQRWVPLSYNTWILFLFDAKRVDRKATRDGGGGGASAPAPSSTPSAVISANFIRARPESAR